MNEEASASRDDAERERIKGEAALKNEEWGACRAHAATAGDPSLSSACERGYRDSLDAKVRKPRKPR